MHQYFVYIMTNKHHSVLYIGVTNNLARRVQEQQDHVVKGFTEKYRVEKLVHYEATTDVRSALQREKQLKNWRREWKIKLIEQETRTWEALSTSL